jgi:hypothetical protein
MLCDRHTLSLEEGVERMSYSKLNLAAAALVLALAGSSGAATPSAAAEPPLPSSRQEAPQPQQAQGAPTTPGEDTSASAEAQPQGTQVFVYPTNGQSPVQADRDRYECHMWAVKQTGFDPSEPHVAPHQRIRVVAMPAPGSSTLAGAVTGAVVGAAVSRPRDSGTGAAVGAIAGALLGHAADTARQQQLDKVRDRYDERDRRSAARLEQQSNDYRRAIAACLEGRGYIVK